MSIRRNLMGACLGLTVATTACALSNNRATANYRVTVSLLVDGKPRTGSAVWSASVSRPMIPLVSRYEGAFHGDAIPIEIGPNHYIFAMLHSSPPGRSSTSFRNPTLGAGNLPRVLFADISPYKGRDEVELLRSISTIRDIPGKLVCEGNGRPIVGWTSDHKARKALFCFTFSESNGSGDPRKLSLIDADRVYFDRSNRIRFLDATLQMTDHPVTEDLKRILPLMKGKLDFSDRIDDRAASAEHLPFFIYAMRR
ncbi:hypothetical protein M9979_02305 [Sphingomonas sp. RP10(2022)]|uniref:DUF4331 domain-containing protein n=2 Tax=Sphingomonas liriopis TaxID=2949094 RepID=A0A9X2HUG0_9SPHN|nr:hypothetical protein [Sphingomonas liriopis]